MVVIAVVKVVGIIPIFFGFVGINIDVFRVAGPGTKVFVIHNCADAEPVVAFGGHPAGKIVIVRVCFYRSNQVAAAV